jgi:hypothetical protein
MKTSKFTDEQIAIALRQAEAGTPVGEICRKRADLLPLEERFGALGLSEAPGAVPARRRESGVEGAGGGPDAEQDERAKAIHGFPVTGRRLPASDAVCGPHREDSRDERHVRHRIEALTGGPKRHLLQVEGNPQPDRDGEEVDDLGRVGLEHMRSEDAAGALLDEHIET